LKARHVSGKQRKGADRTKRLDCATDVGESTLSRNYLDWLLAVPWKNGRKRFAISKLPKSERDILALKIRTHPRILAVRNGEKSKGSILCCRPSRRGQNFARDVVGRDGRICARIAQRCCAMKLKGARRAILAIAGSDHSNDESRHE
jgi:hypothetical protein